MKARKRKIAGAFFGTIVEYYDYSLYGFSAGILAEKFFPEIDKITSLMYVFGIYAIAYFSKPLGSIFFSRIGDLHGRLVALRITIIGMAIPTLAIGLLPDYNSAGVISIYILIICRFTQGFFIGGEYDGAAIYVIEHLGKKYHYTASAITRTSGVLGLLLGIAITNFFNSSIFPDWAWRLPFLFSLPLALITIYFRKFLIETPDFTYAIEQNIKFTGMTKFLKNNWLNLLMVILFAGGFGVTYQIAIIFMKQYLPIIVPATKAIMTSFSVLIVFVFGATMPIAGFLADKFGKIIIVKSSLFLTIVTNITLMVGIHYQIINLVLISATMLAAAVAPFNALAHGIMIKAFTINERYRGVGLGHTIGSTLMSGTAGYVCFYFIKRYDFYLFPLFYIGFFALISYCVIYNLAKRYRN